MLHLKSEKLSHSQLCIWKINDTDIQWLPKLSNKQSHFFFTTLYLLYSKSYGSRVFIYLYHKVSSICMISFSSIDQIVHFLLKKKIITYNFSPSKIIQQVTFWDRKRWIANNRSFLSVLNRFIGVIYKSKIRFATFQSINLGCLVYFFYNGTQKEGVLFWSTRNCYKTFSKRWFRERYCWENDYSPKFSSLHHHEIQKNKMYRKYYRPRPKT